MASSDSPSGDARGPIKSAPFNLYLLDQEYLRNDSRVLWEVYCSWCIHGIVYSKGDRKDKTEARASLRAERDLLLESYFYGAGKSDIGFQDAVVDAMIEQFARHPQLLDKNYADQVYNRTKEGDALRRLLITVITFRLPCVLLKELLASAKPDEFRKDLVAAARPLSYTERREIKLIHRDLLSEEAHGVASVDNFRLRRGWEKPHPWVVNPCLFHQHGKGACPAGLSRRPTST